MQLIPEFTDTELHHVREMLTHRYEKNVEIQLADCEVSIGKNTDDITPCPSVFWYAKGANFIVYKTGQHRFRGQFFYTPHEQFGTDIEEFNELAACIDAVLQNQAEHEGSREDSDSGSGS